MGGLFDAMLGLISAWSLGVVLVAGDLEGTAPNDPVPIVNGTVASTCQWPSAVGVSGCSATLVHPQVIMYAAHCGSANSVRFGESSGSPQFTVGTQYCRDHPDYPITGFDQAYCVLDQPVTDVPIAPVLMGCEREQLKVGRPLTVVGFGQTSGGGGGFGTKRYAPGTVAGFPNDGRIIGVFYDDPLAGACFGDSGGSSFVQLDDGSWRAMAITVTIAGTCGGSSQHVPGYNAVAWIEEDSGIDITPCHDADGAWNPGPSCTGAPLAHGDGAGLSWSNGCSGAPAGPDIETCGPTYGEPPDDVGPQISIVTPVAGAVPGPSYNTAIVVDATDDWGILDVTIRFEDVEVFIEGAGPYEIPSVTFPEGSYEIRATARDWSGNLADATPVVLDVGEMEATGSSGSTDAGSDGGDVGSTTDDGGTSSAGSTGATTGSGTDGVEPAADDEPGCGCRGSRNAAGWTLLPLVCALRRRRSVPRSR